MISPPPSTVAHTSGLHAGVLAGVWRFYTLIDSG